MTYIELVWDIKKRHKTTNELVIYEILFYKSKIVKDKLSFHLNRNKEIDFKIKKIYKLYNQYFIKQKPLSQIIGYSKFYGIKFFVFKKVFEPRSETEEIIEKAQDLIKKNKIFSVVDLCCGTGCVGLTIKKIFPNINITCVDINKKAIKNTKYNMKKLKLQAQVIKGDFYKTLIKNKLKFDLIVCNPPYINKQNINKTHIKYENKISFNNSDNEDFFYKTIIKNKKKVLNDGGYFIYEDKKAHINVINERI